jgi:hypothetical protein
MVEDSRAQRARKRRCSVDPFKTAEEKFGTERAEQLRRDIEQLALETEKLRSIPLEIDDEP